MHRLSAFFRAFLQVFRRIDVDRSAPWGYVKGRPHPYQERAVGKWG